MRRRTVKPGSPEIMGQDGNLETQSSKSETAADSKHEPASESKTIGRRPLDSIVVFITMGTGRRCTICRMVDFATRGSSSSITIESLSFDRFVSILEEEIQFDPAGHGIFYRCTRGVTVPIGNERSWKAAIGDMYAGGVDTFDFHIEETGEHLYGDSRV
jgi:hypothetical protein